jgi:hypothetical protein
MLLGHFKVIWILLNISIASKSVYLSTIPAWMLSISSKSVFLIFTGHCVEGDSFYLITRTSRRNMQGPWPMHGLYLNFTILPFVSSDSGLLLLTLQDAGSLPSPVPKSLTCNHQGNAERCYIAQTMFKVLYTSCHQYCFLYKST